MFSLIHYHVSFLKGISLSFYIRKMSNYSEIHISYFGFLCSIFKHVFEFVLSLQYIPDLNPLKWLDQLHLFTQCEPHLSQIIDIRMKHKNCVRRAFIYKRTHQLGLNKESESRTIKEWLLFSIYFLIVLYLCKEFSVVLSSLNISGWLPLTRYMSDTNSVRTTLLCILLKSNI